MRPIVDYNTASTESYTEFKKLYPRLHKIVKVSAKRTAIIRSVNKKMYELMRDEGVFVQMPFGFGKVGLSKYESKMFDKNIKKRLSVDWKKSKDLGRKVYHTNLHSNNQKVVFLWLSLGKFPYQNFYSIRGMREIERDIAATCKQEGGLDKIEKYVDNPKVKKFRIYLENKEEIEEYRRIKQERAELKKKEKLDKKNKE